MNVSSQVSQQTQILEREENYQTSSEFITQEDADITKYINNNQEKSAAPLTQNGDRPSLLPENEKAPPLNGTPLPKCLGL